jgi:hypothetical protein
MGLLDDAIREHLDLKRRSGGDPAEIERLEREALGGVRREPTASAGTATSVAPIAPEYEADDRLDEPGDVPHAEIVGRPAERQPKRRGFLHRLGSSSASRESAAEVEHDEPGFDPFDDRTSASHETEPPSPAPAHEHDEHRSPAASDSSEPRSPLDDATVEHEAAHGFDDEYRAFEEEPEVADAADDVLEETPEFLQDTPDHDRLWFEQRPPKDFDFDE